MLKMLRVLFLLGAGFSVAGYAAVLGPTDTVKNTVDAVLLSLATGGDEARTREEVTGLITSNFDFSNMAQRILATNWKKANAEQQMRFVELFKQLLANTYWAQIKAYADQRVEYVGEKVKNGNVARVKTLILSHGKSIPVDYSLQLDGDRWMAYDVVIEGISLVRNFRGSYQQIAKQEGIDGLLAKLEEKLSAPGK